jgi:hypothetical protein
MTYDLATARARIGLPDSDTSKDPLLTAAMEAALALAETYCDRRFKLAAIEERVIHFVGNAAQLIRYPLKKIVTVIADGMTLEKYHMETNTGRVVGDGFLAAHELVIDYEGGYETLPADLELALWLVFDALWPGFSGAGAASSISGVSSISVPDVGTLRFSADSAAGAGGSGTEYGLLPTSSVAILNMYRRVLC